MNAWWQMWEESFSPSECQIIINQALKTSQSQGSIGTGKGNRVDEDYRRSNVRWLSKVDPQWQWVFSRMEHMFQIANQNTFNFELSYFSEIQFTEYSSEYKGKYDWHEDTFWVPNEPTKAHRKLSMVIQLSDPDDYTGGELQLAEQPPQADRLAKQGTVIIFPSFLRHRVTDTLTGTRYSLVSWYKGPMFR